MQLMLMGGHKHLSSLAEVILRNIDACKPLSNITQTSLGPNGMNQMAYKNSLPNALLASTVQTAWEDIPYSPFLVTQSMLAKYSNMASSIGGPNMNMSEALRANNISMPQAQPSQHALPWYCHWTSLPQRIAVHPYSQPTLPFGHFTDNGAATPAGLVAASLSHAFALFVAVSAGANISDGHITLVRGLLYWIAQLLGSVVACLLLNIAIGGWETSAFSLSSGVGATNALVFEIVMTFGLVYTVYATAIDPKNGSLGTIAPFAIGFIVGANILADEDIQRTSSEFPSIQYLW
ncbi:uncharacterized protein LOC131653150 [Vicia villosa]|uniref:uncharacterized protein LOC131653150 n=1 Tax=Vicia villosa TaxID=3911 RepID=UPI00273BC4D5|nr:uncharacterized protein LOC131653150 [Vicia villosa]XP_058779211.1 uncharacterized protein LOC131653150 [Vicia villosa]